MIKKAVILAAGNGSRIKRFKGDVPKPLRKVAGLTLIKRSILTLRRAGIDEVWVVVGYKGDQIVQALSNDKSLGTQVHFITNEDWKKSNGVSVLCAKDYIQEDFLLLMADHVFDPKAVQKMAALTLGRSDVVLGVDKRLSEIFDLDDVTKVALSGDRIAQIGKGLQTYQAFDTGIFACSHELFEALETIYRQKQDASLSDGITYLAERGRAGTCNLSQFWWQDVDTPEAVKHAERILFQSVKKPTDGFISRNLNRRISGAITRLLVKTNLSANHVTGLVTLIGVLSGVMVATGHYFEIAIGGLLFKLASILDGCDGELSKLKMTSSKMGEWLDTASDNLTYVVFLIGVVLGIYHQGIYPHVLFESSLMFFGLAMTLGVMVFYLARYTNSGSLVTIQNDLNEEEKVQSITGISTWLTKIKFMMKRDFFALVFMSLAVMDQLTWILHLSVIGTNLTWIIVLAYKKEIFKINASAKVVETSR